ncbi:hypothetical protein TNCT_77451 [Trichonephila clavata]|uniref:Uncharacterized protein n=1 Tax=Trichonephila clavata TaxID=2740835 RepID=A0A8X6HSS8_TRICU|nr:hypothetical protein TNCT_77451 [Trichonephila clavata]
MSLETFGTMSRVIRLDNKSTRQKRRKLDKLAAVQEDLAVLNYIAKKKNVIRMSTLHRGKEVSNIPDKYPLVILDYNLTKWDVGNLDQLLNTNTCERKTNRWSMIVFYNILLILL